VASPSEETTAAFDPAATGTNWGAEAGAGGPGLGVVGGYRLLRPLGAGGMGTVFEAEQLAPEPAAACRAGSLGRGRRVGLKLIRPEFVSSPEALERFRREGRLASTLSHPRCVFVLTADEDAGRPYIAMELMPGATLRDLVAESGPLPPLDAVTKILDVIDGLRALHRRGVIHRDVKPGNCFLEADGRVKVGDFGLARSLVAEGELTQTGKFLGTPLFASPEQHKGEAVDERTDVYSVAATLYFLLTGRAPFQSAGAAAVVARAASEPAPSMRLLRPDLPPDLDRVVLRGLERDRRRRWRDLGEFRAALLPFRVVAPSVDHVRLRMAAYLIDYLVLWGIWGLLYLALRPLWPDVEFYSLPRISMCGPRFDPNPMVPITFLVSSVPDLVYFTVLEGLWGFALGKWLLRLRVVRLGTDRPPGLLRAFRRTLVFCVILHVLMEVVNLLPLDFLTKLLLTLLAMTKLGNTLILLTTMRQRNGYRGLHEFLSGTATVRLAPAVEGEGPGWLRRACADVLAGDPPGRDGLPAALGPFRVRGALHWDGDAGVLHGEDATLGRNVLLWLRPAGEAPLSAARQDVNRLTRLRWLTAGADGGVRWDAFVAEAGCPLPEFVAAAGTLSWAETRSVLAALADELDAACADGTLPDTPAADHVWVQPGGEVRLLDMPPRRLPVKPTGRPDVRPQSLALSLLGEVAVLALEGQPRSAGDAAHPVRAALPLHAAWMLARLLKVEEPYQSVAEFQADLVASQDRPMRISRGRRAMHILVQALLALLALLAVLLPCSDRISLSLLPLVPVASIVWAGLARGGPSFGLCGVALARADGRRVRRRQAALRSFLVWLQGTGLVLIWWSLYHLVLHLTGEETASSTEKNVIFWIWAAAALLYVVLAVWLPRRPWHDRVTGTRLVPQ
jgi:hypothetical protein